MTKIIETLTEAMKVEEGTISQNAETAMRTGERIARKYGETCIGVTYRETRVLETGELGGTIGFERTVRGYSPVLVN